MPRRRPGGDEEEGPRVPIQEQLLIDLLPEVSPTRLFCTSVGRGQFAIAASERYPDSAVTCHFFDMFYAEATRALATLSNLNVVCTPEFPVGPFDVAAIPVRSSGNAELTRERLQAAHVALAIGGRMLCATDNADDSWLHAELRKLFPKVTRRPLQAGVVYLATKQEPLRKLKNFECLFAFRDQGRLIQLISRPGVFSHRELDGGARALIKVMEVSPGDNVFEIGCGSGAVSLAAASRARDVKVLAIDSDCRAVQCTQRGAELNRLTNIDARVNCTGEAGIAGTYDLAVGNPPYFSQYQIAFLFLRATHRALKPGGRVMMVTKTPNWYDEHMPEYFTDISFQSVSGYTVVSARKPHGRT